MLQSLQTCQGLESGSYIQSPGAFQKEKTILPKSFSFPYSVTRSGTRCRSMIHRTGQLLAAPNSVLIVTLSDRESARYQRDELVFHGGVQVPQYADKGRR